MELLHIEIQPCDVFRFRYKSESETKSEKKVVSHGKLKGSLPDKPENKNSNFPTVKLHGKYNVQDKIEIKASLYTDEQKRRPHFLELFGKNCKNGKCWETISKDGTAVFRYLEIESKRREKVIDILVKEKISNLDGREYKIEIIEKEAEEEYKLINMNCAVLCFEAFLNGRSISPKVFSTPITNKKAAASNLKIYHISRCAGNWEGGDDVILLCENLKKADKIEINFSNEGENDVPWKENGIFNPKADVYHQVTAIIFKTPKYQNHSGGKVSIKLHRPSDEQSSEPKEFIYIPGEIDSLRKTKKRKLSSELVEKGYGLASTSSGSGYGSSSPVSPMEEDFVMKSPKPNVSGSYQPLSMSSDIPVGHEVVASTSRILESTRQVVHENNKILSYNDGPGDSISEFLNQEYGRIDTLHWPIPQEDLDNNLPNEQSSEVKLDAAEPYDLNPELVGGVIGNLEQNVSPRAIWPQSSTLICQDPYLTLTSGRDETFFGKIYAGMRYLGTLIPSTEEPIEYPCSSSMIPSIRDLKDIAIYGLESGIEKVASYIKPSHDSNNYNAISKNGQIDAAVNDSFKTSNNKVSEESGLSFNMKHLSIKDTAKCKKAVKNNVNMELPIGVNVQSRTNKNSEENKSYKNEVEINCDFEHIKEGINCIMKNREKDLQYISKLMSVADEVGNIFLHLAVKEQNENVNLITEILKICPDFINKQNNFKETPLHLATKVNAHKIVRLLLSNGGNPSIANVKGNNCFHIASKFNFTDSMEILLLPGLKYGKYIPSLDEINYEGLAPVHLAVLNNSRESLKLLLHAGADINIKDLKSGSSPLHFAVKNLPSLVQDLLSYPRVNLLNKDFRGHTFVHVLCNMKGVPFPSINQSRDLINWALKILALPAIDAREVSSVSSDTDSSGEENDEEATIATTTREDSALAQSSIINDVDRNLFSKECEERLTSYLDNSCHWRKLGLLLLGLDEKTLNGLETLSKSSSPSKVILKKIKNSYKPCDKQTLINILIEADMKEAVNILNN